MLNKAYWEEDSEVYTKTIESLQTKMTTITILNSPLEPFKIHPILIENFYFPVTNQLVTLALVIGFLLLNFIAAFGSTEKAYSTKSLIVIKFFYEFIVNLVNNSIHVAYRGHFVPYIFSLFVYILSLNLTGLIPYSFAITGQIAFTLSMAYIAFIGTILMGWRTHKIKFFGKFFPGNLDIALAPLLVPIELISYLFQPLSLAIRLFANIMAGHILMGVFSLFIWMLSSLTGVFFTAATIPALILVPLCVLELAVSLIQTYVFCLLTCIYINDVLNLH